MIEVYKIGEHLYKNGDKNSGLHEYNIIKNNLYEYYNNNVDKFPNDMIIILNGCLGEGEGEEEYLLDKMKYFKVKVFIASDIISFTNNKCIIENCDVLLHQCPNRNIKGFNIKQYYSYVPELFFEDSGEIKYTCNNNLLFFGGGVRDMGDVLYEIQKVQDCNFILKDGASDNRMYYEDYMKEQRKYNYTLILCRSDYSKIGWVTSRFIECIGNNNFPIVLDCYDTDNYFKMSTINSIDNIPIIINYIHNNEVIYKSVINHYKCRFENDKFKLLELLERINNE